jgi:hypothetical protein
VTGGGKTYRDGRAICNLCGRTAIVDEQQAAAAAHEVKALLARVTLDVTGDHIPVHLAYWDEMNNSDHSDYEDNPIGLAKMTAQGSVRKMESITIVYGLPKLHFCGIYAHEMGHAWMWLNNYPDDISPQVKEGLCNLFKYLWLKQQHTPESKYLQHMMLQNQDRIYGNGFRLAQVKFKKYRLLQLLDYVKSHRSFPG